jgi:tetratricopeptide (TPR) repeat protein
MQTNNNEKQMSEDKINDFIQRNRKVIFSIFGIIVVLFLGTVIYLSISDALRKKAITSVEELDKKYEDLYSKITDDDAQPEINELLEELNAFAQKNSGYAGGKAWSLIAQIHSEKKEWSEAQSAWTNAAKKSSKTFLGPVSYFNAAACAEELGKKEEAVELYIKCISLPVAFPQAARAQFALGRLYEDLNDIPSALEAYRVLMEKWSNSTTWVNLAHSRIIYLEMQ